MLDKTTTATTITVGTDAFLAALRRVRFAISQEETRYYLRGVFLHVEGGKLVLVATDGRRLSRAELDYSGETVPPAVILPEECVAAILKVKKIRRTWDTRINVSPMKVSIHVPTRDNSQPVIDCQPIQGAFPDYKRVIPTANEIHATVDRTAFAHLCAGLAAFNAKAALGSTTAAKLDFNGTALRVTCTPHVEAGRGVTNIPVAISATLELAAPVKQPIMIGFNPGSLADMAKSFDGDYVTIELSDACSPTIMRAQNEHLIVLMPMRV